MSAPIKGDPRVFDNVMEYNKDASLDDVTLITADNTPIDTSKLKEEIGKILFAARILNIRGHYVPQRGWAADNLNWPPPDTVFFPTIRVTYQALLGTFLFKCEESELLKIRIPGINSVYENYRISYPEKQEISNGDGIIVGIRSGYPFYVVLPPPREIIYP